MAIFELPLQTGSQEFYTTLNGKTYKLRLIWRDPIGWFLDIHDVADLPLANGIAVVTGVNLIKQYQHLIKGELWVYTDGLENPDYKSVGSTLKLYWVDP
ncbi:hypothetical protein F900_00723 [Acinetobacter modestus]|uniref:Cyanophage baseplate Pam3 plug gp18 domain-containing protein n=1 Tax=Acinetobacter modestus TaxID=1776740 RepID=N9M555_9GAMM|nr:hypothetical protein [Acinetobacter modestus]ENX03629.1 hypothetical protein F900_00723 [Acinetobacter modestus]